MYDNARWVSQEREVARQESRRVKGLSLRVRQAQSEAGAAQERYEAEAVRLRNDHEVQAAQLHEVCRGGTTTHACSDNTELVSRQLVCRLRH
jgi:hypothetical protein